MTGEQAKQLLKDLHGFIHFCEANPKAFHPISQLATISHDVNGSLCDETCFLPRVNGYAKYAEKAEPTDGR
jgi:hypothetical protein